MYDVAVVGAGVSGLTCATFLADAGLDVIVLESSPKIGGFMKENLQGLPRYEIDQIPFNIPRDKPSKTIVLWSPNKKRVDIKFNEPICYLVKRGGTDSFDLYLANMAKKAGAEIVTNSSIVKSKWTGNFMEEVLDRNGRSYRAKYFVAADGASSQMRRLSGVGILQPKGIGFGMKMKKVKIAPLEMHVILNLNLAPHGYCYLIGYPYGNYASVVVSARVRYIKKNLRQYFSEFIRSYPEIFGDAEGIHEFARSVTCNDGSYSLRKGNLLFVGEAGGFQDPTLGFGMVPSIRSSKIASIAIIKSMKEKRMSILSCYERTARTHILRDYVTWRWNFRKVILEHMNNDDFEALIISSDVNKALIRKIVQAGNIQALIKLIFCALSVRPQLARFLFYAPYVWLPFQL
jgi:flavin-dependent dehydrogenase